MKIEDIVPGLEKKLADEGKLIEAGWVGLCLAAMNKDAPPEQMKEMRMAFFAGAQHLFSCMLRMIDPSDDETPDDLRRMEQIHAELQAFAEHILQRAAAEGMH